MTEGQRAEEGEETKLQTAVHGMSGVLKLVASKWCGPTCRIVFAVRQREMLKTQDGARLQPVCRYVEAE